MMNEKRKGSESSSTMQCECDSKSFYVIIQGSGAVVTCCTYCEKETGIKAALLEDKATKAFWESKTEPKTIRSSRLWEPITDGAKPKTFVEAMAAWGLDRTAIPPDQIDKKYRDAFAGDSVFADVFERFDDPENAWVEFLSAKTAEYSYPAACDCPGCVEGARVGFTSAFLWKKEIPAR